MTADDLTEAQQTAFAEVNDSYGIASYKVEDGLLKFEADDGDTGYIDVDGTWGWDK